MSDSTGKTIDEVTPDTSVGGAEKIPISDAGTPKSVTTAKIKEYVIAGIADITSASSATIASDSVYIKQDGAMKLVSADVLATAIYGTLFGKSSASVATTQVLAVKSGDDVKTFTVGDLVTYVQSQITSNFDIHALPTTSNTIDGGNFIAISQSVSSVWTMFKLSLSNLCYYIFSRVYNYATESTSAFGNTDMLLSVDANGTMRRTALPNAGLATGNVTGPNDAIANNIPQWTTTNGKTLKSGLSVATSIDSTSQNSQLPTAKAVYDVLPIMDDVVYYTGESVTTGSIPYYANSTGKVLGQGYAVDTILNPSAANDFKIPTSLAVVNAMSALKVVKQATSLPSIETEGVLDGDVFVITTSTEFVGIYVAYKAGTTPAWYQITTTIVS